MIHPPDYPHCASKFVDSPDYPGSESDKLTDANILCCLRVWHRSELCAHPYYGREWRKPTLHSPGLYRLHWKSGGFSLAAVGILHDGRNWYAPVNWTNKECEGVASSDWSGVLRVDEIDVGPANWSGI